MSEETTSDANWTSAMVETLLKCRLKTFRKDFLNAKEKKKVTAAWNRIVLEINTAHHVKLSQKQIKAKWLALSKQYRTLTAEDEATGNKKKSKKPVY
ncbi:hypothetical protein HK098_007410 [Nowakowskiella sp. JEL0407]|nr:hypothetical protein HK098_007410 [Nowakowskiella sp. JEL0407]